MPSFGLNCAVVAVSSCGRLGWIVRSIGPKCAVVAAPFYMVGIFIVL